MSVREHSFPTGARPPSVEVRNRAGSVTVTAVEGAERVEVRVEALDSAAEEMLDEVEVSGPSAPGDAAPSVRVLIPERWLLRTPRFSITVTTPAGATVRVAAASADTGLRGPLGALTVTTASGDVDVEATTGTQVRSASGDVRIGTATGRAVVGTASGDVRVESAEHGLEVRTASGDVSVGRAAEEISIGTASGDVEIDVVERGTVRLKSVSGDATVGVAAGQRVWLELSSVSGRMRSELGGDDSGAASGPATVSITARTVSGDVRVLRAARGAAA
jgi:Putative adhesin